MLLVLFELLFECYNCLLLSRLLLLLTWWVDSAFLIITPCYVVVADRKFIIGDYEWLDDDGESKLCCEPGMDLLLLFILNNNKFLLFSSSYSYKFNIFSLLDINLSLFIAYPTFLLLFPTILAISNSLFNPII